MFPLPEAWKNYKPEKITLDPRQLIKELAEMNKSKGPDAGPTGTDTVVEAKEPDADGEVEGYDAVEGSAILDGPSRE